MLNSGTISEAFAQLDGEPLLVVAKKRPKRVNEPLETCNVLITLNDVPKLRGFGATSFAVDKNPKKKKIYYIQYEDFRAAYRQKAMEKNLGLRDALIMHTPLPEAVIDHVLLEQLPRVPLELPSTPPDLHENVIVVNANIIRISDGVAGFGHFYYWN